MELLCHAVILGQKQPCVLVATSSVMGIVPKTGSYGVGKHSALAVTESGHDEFWNARSPAREDLRPLPRIRCHDHRVRGLPVHRLC